MNKLTRTLAFGTILAGLTLSASPALSQERPGRGERAQPTAEERAEARQQLAQELDLTPAQAAQMDSIQTSVEARRAALMETAGDGDREAMREDMKQLRQDADTAIKQVLTEDQQTRYAELRSKGGERRGDRGGDRGARKGQRQ